MYAAAIHTMQSAAGKKNKINRRRRATRLYIFMNEYGRLSAAAFSGAVPPFSSQADNFCIFFHLGTAILRRKSPSTGCRIRSPAAIRAKPDSFISARSVQKKYTHPPGRMKLHKTAAH
jgi:hypothetical protein